MPLSERVAWNQPWACGQLDGTEVAEVDRRDGAGTTALGDGEHDGIDEAQIQGVVLPVELVRTLEILFGTQLDREVASGEIGEERIARGASKLGACQVVDLGQNRPREKPLGRILLVDGLQYVVMLVIGIEQREDPASVGDDHRDFPNPASKSSARSLRSFRPLRNAPTLAGSRCSRWRAAYSATASRTSDAVGTPRRRAIRFSV